MPRATTADIHKANNPWTPADFAEEGAGLDWNAFFDAAELGRPADVRRLALGRDQQAGRAGRPASRSQAWKD